MRLDNYLTEKKYFDSRTKAKQAIERGEVFIDGKKAYKPSIEIKDDNIKVEHIFTKNYVSLGGYKLEKALNDFNFNVDGLIVADIGASTGGFTDCLLQNNAKKVYAVDLNDTLLHNKLKNDSRVSLIVKNAKELLKNDFSNEIDLIVADLSFISISQVIHVFSNLISKNKKLILLIKPQFEIGMHKRFKNGIIKDKNLHKEICDRISKVALENNLRTINLTPAPIYQDKNVEFLILLEKV